MNTQNDNTQNIDFSILNRRPSTLNGEELDMYRKARRVLKAALCNINPEAGIPEEKEEAMKTQSSEQTNEDNVTFAIRTLYGRVLKINSLSVKYARIPEEVEMQEHSNGRKAFVLPKEAWSTDNLQTAEIALDFVKNQGLFGCKIVEIPEEGICKKQWVADSKAYAKEYCKKHRVQNPWEAKKTLKAKRERFLNPFPEFKLKNPPRQQNQENCQVAM